ncbi:MAG: hypothetical protein GC164_09970 [Phycisphaera sp.]|nr:hypothetical protein [Phycisphaera sp.]
MRHTYCPMLVVCVFLSLASPAFVRMLDAASINLPADFQPKETDFADSGARGQFLGMAGLRGRPLKPIDGINALYVIAVQKDKPAAEYFREGDAITALNGQPLSGDSVTRIKTTLSAADQYRKPVVLDLWRAGQSQRITIEFKGPQPPDLTNGGEPNLEQISWNLGTTGAAGWTWSIPHQTTEGAKQIYITRIAPGTPAEGILNVGDVVVGVFGKNFATDARKEFGWALTKAETTEQGGKLVLEVWNNGKSREVTVPIRVMGDYSESAPFDSAKTQKIVDEAVAYLKAKGVGGGIGGLVNTLGLLSTGREDVMPIVSEKVHEVASSFPPDHAWTAGYSLVLMCEYYLATKDNSVKPAIEAYAIHIARGQSQVGTWGHRICIPYQFSDGTLYGVAPGYGALNQAGLICMLGLALTQKCGVDDADIRQAVFRGDRFFRFFIDKGSIPYGDHGPGIDGHEDNGKNSLAAVMFDILDDKEAAAFFTRMTVASFNEREGGHTGNYFNFLWGPLGAARGGDEAAAVFMRKLEWFFDLERRAQGNFEYQGKPGMTDSRNSENVYKGWDTTGARLLAYCLPLKKLYITGKGRSIPDITGSELAQSVAAGELTARQYIDLPTSELLARLSSWSPAERDRAGKVLEVNPDNVVPQLIAMLDSDNRYARYGACQALRYAGRASQPAADALVAKLKASDDDTFKFFAMRAFSSYNTEMGLGAVAAGVAPAMMELAYTGHFDDPTGKLQAEFAQAMFYSGNAQPFRAIARNAEGIDKIDSDVLVKTVRELLQNTNGGARSATSIVYNKLSDEQLKLLWKDIYKAVRNLAPSGIMFANGVRERGIELMAQHHTREGMETAVWYLTNQKFHGGPDSTKNVLDTLVNTYGGYAKAVLPQLEKAAEYYEPGGIAGPSPGRTNAQATLIREAMEKIKTAPTPEWELTSIAEYLK